MSTDVSLQMVRSGKRFATFFFLAFVRPLLSMNPRVLLEITQSCEKFRTDLTVERFPIVQPLMGPQPIPGVECLLAARFGANIRFDFRVDPYVDFLTVRSQKCLRASIFCTFELVFTSMGFHVSS